MINTKHKTNPAWTAIAAVLAFGSTPALAQEVTASPAPTTQAPTTQAPPAQTAQTPSATAPLAPPVINLPPVTTPPPAPVQTAPAPTVQPIPQTVQVPEIKLPPVEQKAKTEARQATPVPVEKAVTERPAQNQAARSNNTASSNTAPAEAAVSEAIAETETIANGELDAIVENASVAAIEPATASGASAQIGESNTSWGLTAGIIALLLGGIAAAMMVFRRRKTPEEHPAFTETQPVTGVKKAKTEEMAVAIEADETPEPAIGATAPAYAATAMSPRTAPINSSKLEKMVAEAPSEANPFRTRKNRLRRAQFILRQREAAVAKFDRSNSDNGFVTTKPVSRDAQIVTRETEDA